MTLPTGAATAGRAMDMQIAEKVMGWVRGRSYANGNGDWIVDGATSPSRTWNLTPHYSTDIAAAWLVVEKMRALGYQLDLSHALGDAIERPLLYAKFSLLRGYTNHANSDSAPLVICKAALLAAASQRDDNGQ